LATRTGIHPTQFQKIREGVTRKFDPETLRKISAGTGIPLMDLIVASGMFTAEELDAKVVHRDPHELSNDELLALVRARMRRDLDRDAGIDDMSAFETDDLLQVDEEETGRRRPRLVQGDNGGAINSK
jgi:hypothetical protein